MAKEEAEVKETAAPPTPTPTPTPAVEEEDKDTKEPSAKKAKMEEESKVEAQAPAPAVVEEAPDNEWPEAWVMSEDVEDQKKPNKMEPNVPVDAAALRELGIR